MQTLTTIAEDDELCKSRTVINNNFSITMSNNSGTAFPTENLVVGMFCDRTDLQQIYKLVDTTPTWKLVFDYNYTATYQEYIDTAISEINTAPIGSISIYAGSTAPDGYLLCDGSAVSRTTYESLYSVIGTTYGEGDGSTTFNLPSLKDRFPLGLGSTYSTLAATGGESTHTLTKSEMPSHSHTQTSATSSSSGSSYTDYNNSSGSYTTNTTVLSTGSTGGGGSHNNMPPYIVLNYIIKY